MIVTAKELLFGQHRPYTWPLLGPDWANCSIVETPHFKFLCGDKDAYVKYLRASWEKFKSVDITKQIEGYSELFANIKDNGVNIPIKVCSRPDGGKIVIDGNHRAAIAIYLNLPLVFEDVPWRDYAKQLALRPTVRFGAPEGVPYQTIRYGDEVVVEGRRDDLRERQALIDVTDLQGKEVIDFGANLGMSSIAASICGAKVTAVEIDFNLIVSCVRLGVLFGQAIEVYFDVPDRVFDTAFCFSMHRHADISHIKAEVMYLETHEDGGCPDLPYEHKKFLGSVDGRRKLYKLWGLKRFNKN